MGRLKHKIRGFTLIEIIVTIVLLAIIMIPVGLIMIEYARSIVSADDMTAALNLATQEMAVVNNLDVSTDPTLASGYNKLTSNYAGSKFDLRRQVLSVGQSGTYHFNYIKSVTITVYPNSSSRKIVELVTYLTIVPFGPGIGLNYTDAGKITTKSSSGSALRDGLYNVELTNGSTVDDVVLTGIKILTIDTQKPNRQITSIDISSSSPVMKKNLFKGTITLPYRPSQPMNINFQNSVTLSKGTTYKNDGFSITLKPVSDYTLYQGWYLYISFVLQDGSSTKFYQWRYRRTR